MNDTIKLICRGPNGVVEIELSDPDQAVSIARDLSGLASAPVALTRPRIKPRLHRGDAPRGEDVAAGYVPNIPGHLVSRYKTALRFLEAIRDAGDTGLSPQKLGELLGISDLRGIGGNTAKINRVLKTIGHEHRYVYSNIRTAEGRTWTPKSRINDAIASLKRDLNVKSNEK